LDCWNIVGRHEIGQQYLEVTKALKPMVWRGGRVAEGGGLLSQKRAFFSFYHTLAELIKAPSLLVETHFLTFPNLSDFCPKNS
jgi:hypothetical protein